MNHRSASVTGRLITILFSVTYLLVFNQVSAQNVIGRQNVDQYPVTSWGTPTYGLTWLPTDYYQNTSQSYPLIIFLHGAGEPGTGEGGLWNLLRTGLPQIISNGWNPEAKNPVNGQNYKFIVVSPQAPAWSYAWSSLQWILKDVLSRYRVDPSRVYVTGLSAGGAGSWSCYTNGFDAAQKFAAIVPVSSAGTNTPPEDAQIPYAGGTYGGRVWSVCGAQDAWMSFANTSTQTFNNANPAPAVPAEVTGITGADHTPSAWNTAYDHNWRNNQLGLNIFEWMLKHTRGSTPVPLPAPVPAPTPTPTIVATTISSATILEAETFSTMYGGLNVGWMNNSDWMDYFVNVLSPGTYTVNFRVATPNSGAKFDLRKSDGTVLTTVSIPNTGGYQNWQTVSATVTLSAGEQNLKIYCVNASGGWNINWMEFVQANTPPPTPSPTGSKIEAESFSSMQGIKTENTADAGGGLNVGWQENNDWMDYAVNLANAGTYTVNFRVATANTGVQFQLRSADGAVLTTVTVPNTGWWQTYQTVSATVNLPAGQQTLRIFTADAKGSGWNFNWWEIAGAATTPPTGSKIEAESFSSMQGIKTENTADAGGGLNVGWQENNDWMDYAVNLANAGTYTVNFRVATANTGVQFQLRSADGAVLTTVTVPNTGWWQTYQTVSATVNLPAGQQTLRIFTADAKGSGWNFNWWEITSASAAITSARQSATTEKATTEVSSTPSLQVFPNPVTDRFNLTVNNNLTGAMKVEVISMQGAVTKQFSLNKTAAGAAQFYLSIGELPTGNYIIRATMQTWTEATQIVKE